MKRFIVLDNVTDGLFITTKDNIKNYDPELNPRAKPDLEKSILNEFKIAIFTRVNEEVEKAETQKYTFYIHKEDAEDNITWVEEK